MTEYKLHTSEFMAFIVGAVIGVLKGVFGVFNIIDGAALVNVVATAICTGTIYAAVQVAKNWIVYKYFPHLKDGANDTES